MLRMGGERWRDSGDFPMCRHLVQGIQQPIHLTEPDLQRLLEGRQKHFCLDCFMASGGKRVDDTPLSVNDVPTVLNLPLGLC